MKTKQSCHFGVKALNSVLPVLLAFLIGGIIILAIGENPLTTYRVMVERSLFSLRGVTRTLQLAAPLLLSGMAISICFKANIFNMGIEGQLVFGGFMEATGLRSRRTVILLMLISGALAGIAGTGHMLSEKTFYTLDFSGSPGLGWDGMLIALLGRHSPGGILVAALFYSALKTGSEAIGLYANVPNEIVAVIQSLIILFLAVRFLNEKYGLAERLREKLTARRALGEEGKA